MKLNKSEIASFQGVVWQYYQENKREMPWRQSKDGVFDPYSIMVSEIMLQQTQVSRVTEKYNDFLRAFPNSDTLAAAPLSEVLNKWIGLGYNRRAKYLWQAAKEIQTNHGGIFPQSTAELVRLPGIGPNTAGAILAYAFNIPTVFIETNIRSVLLHHFFSSEEKVSEKQFHEVMEQTVDHRNPREWYWALMDYGQYIKRNSTRHLHKAAIHRKQSTFQGSLRQIRGKIIREVTSSESIPENTLKKAISDERFEKVLAQLIKEKLLKRHGSTISISDG